MTVTTVEEAWVAARKLNAYCNKLPLLREYIQLREQQPPGVPFYCDKAWHARGEQLLLAGLFSGAAMGPTRWPDGTTPPISFGDTFLDTTVSFEERILHLAIRMAHATPFLWTHDVVRTIITSPPLPPHTISSSVLPNEVMFWTFESSYPLTMVSPDGEKRQVGTINWLLLFRVPDGVAVIWDESQDATLSWRLFGGLLKFGQAYPDSPPANQPSSAYITDIALKCLAFLGSPYIQTETKRIDRPVFRRCVAVNPVEAEKRVNVVTLRHAHQPPGPPADGTAGVVEWRHQWWVQGHFRAQWYPSEQAHRVIWIASHLKGPDDKPILEKVYAVKR